MSSTRHCLDTTVWQRSGLWRLPTRYLYVVLDRWTIARLILGTASPTPSCQPLCEMAWLVPWGSWHATKWLTSSADGSETYTPTN